MSVLFNNELQLKVLRTKFKFVIKLNDEAEK